MIPVAPGQQGQPWAVPSQPVRPEPTEESLLPMVHRGHGHSQQPQGAEALKGQWRDALQGVVAEDPVQRKEATQRGHPELHAAPPHPCPTPSSAQGTASLRWKVPWSLGSPRNTLPQTGQSAAQCPHLQGGELTHVGEGGVAQ